MEKVKKIIFLSNYLSHHQTPLSDALWKITDGNYVFVETSSEPTEVREKQEQAAQEKPYVIIFNGNENAVKKMIREADVVISGSAPEHLVRERIRTGKLLFRYSERPLKKGLEIWRFPDRFIRWNWRNPFWKPIYMLCASAYTAQDYGKFGLFKHKVYRWGYFPETKRYADLDVLMTQKNATEILWCGRFLEWKHPDDAITVAWKLKSEGYRFHMKFIGSGVMEEYLRHLVQKYQLEDCVSILGQMNHNQVRNYMEKAGIFLFTSDRQEGWGAVLNESMNSGCAVIASNAIGSVPYLLKDDENGMVYESGNVEMLCEKVKYLLDRSDEQRRLGMAAYYNIVKVWNASNAAARLVNLAEQLLNNNEVRPGFASGPCSRAD